MADADEVEQIQLAFKKADKSESGYISRPDLESIFRELENWSQDDLAHVFQEWEAAGGTADGPIPYADFIEWIMTVGGHDDEEDAGDESDDDDAQQIALSKETAPPGVDIDLQECFTVEDFVTIMCILGDDENEAKHVYSVVVADTGKENPELFEFLDDLDIEIDDVEGLSQLAKAVSKLKEGKTNGQVIEKDGSLGLKLAISKVVRALDRAKQPAEAAWTIISQGNLGLTEAGDQILNGYQDRQEELVKLVQEFMLKPPCLLPSAGQAGVKRACVKEVDAVIDSCRSANTKFVDGTWDLENKMNEVLYVDKQKPGWDCTVAKPASFKRLSEISEGLMLWKDGVRAGDINQGQIGTCFLLGALGAITSAKPDKLKKIFIKYDVEIGIYAVRFNVNGDWTYVIVDDLMPVDTYGRLLFAHSKDPQEAWVPILEKAYCKLHTCYEMCDGGRASEAIFTFFGGVSGKIQIRDVHQQEPGKYFLEAKQAKEKGWLLTTTFVKTKGSSKGQGKCGEDVLPTGLVGGHVYSVLKLVDAEGHKLVCCRNPWGTGEWTGKWSDKNTDGEWTDSMKEATGYAGLNDGKFWMSIEDFVATSGGIDFTRTFGANYWKMTHYSKFQKGAVKAVSQWPYAATADDEVGFEKGATLDIMQMSSGWWYGNVAGEEKKGYFPGNYVKLTERPIARFDLVGTPLESDTPMKAVVMLMQPNAMMKRRFYKRKQDGLNYKDTKYPRIELSVVGPDGKVAVQKAGKRRCVWTELELPGGGLWQIYALSVDGVGCNFVLRVYVTKGTATLEEKLDATTSQLFAAMS